MKKLRNILCALLVMSLCIGLGNSFIASANGDILVILDGMALEFDVPPQIINNRTMVPLRVIFEELGAEVEWENETRTVTATKDDLVVQMTIGVEAVIVNGVSSPMDIAPLIINNRTLVPARFVSESFGCKVGWDNNSRTVYINSGENDLVGKWEFFHGNDLFYFTESYGFEFFADGMVTEDQNEITVDWFISDPEYFILIFDDGFIYSFDYNSTGYLLRISDSDENTALFVREGSVDYESGDYSELAGPWGFIGGDAIYFFMQDEEFAFNPDYTIYFYDSTMSGIVIMTGSSGFVLVDEFGNGFWFTYSISGDELTVTDSDGDVSVYARREAYG